MKFPLIFFLLCIIYILQHWLLNHSFQLLHWGVHDLQVAPIENFGEEQDKSNNGSVSQAKLRFGVDNGISPASGSSIVRRPCKYHISSSTSSDVYTLLAVTNNANLTKQLRLDPHRSNPWPVHYHIVPLAST